MGRDLEVGKQQWAIEQVAGSSSRKTEKTEALICVVPVGLKAVDFESCLPIDCGFSLSVRRGREREAYSCGNDLHDYSVTECSSRI